VEIEIFSTPQCSYCEAAKKLLDEKGLDYTNLDVMADQVTLEDFKRRLPRVKAVPQIFIDGEHIGGYEDLRLLDQTGRLETG
jgi:glutaredoxin 3